MWFWGIVLAFVVVLGGVLVFQDDHGFGPSHESTADRCTGSQVFC